MRLEVECKGKADKFAAHDSRGYGYVNERLLKPKKEI